MSSMTIAPITRPDAETGSCPSWCAYTPLRGFGEICTSETHDVPAASPVHVCGFYEFPDEEDTDTCEATIDATLSAYEGDTWISVSHGDDYLPALTVDAAEQLAWHILSLVAAAREG